MIASGRVRRFLTTGDTPTTTTHTGEENMTTALQTTTNAANAARSTGPKTTEGKTRSSKNALRHGLRSDAPVLPGERAEDWEAHLAGIFASLAPLGTLEETLAGRVALCLWRLDRVARYETKVTTVRLAEASEEIRSAESLPNPFDREPKKAAVQLKNTLDTLEKTRQFVNLWEGGARLLEQLLRTPDEAKISADDVDCAFHDLWTEAEKRGHCPDPSDGGFLAIVGVPHDEIDTAFAWEGWTAGMVKKGLARLASAAKLPPEKLLARAVKARQDIQESNKAAVGTLERKVMDLRRHVRIQEERAQQRLLLLDEKTLGTVSRYEAHLSRQMLQALHTLERLQAARAGQTVPPPAALDVTVDTGGEASPVVGAFTGRLEDSAIA
jgi:hypothetical protein